MTTTLTKEFWNYVESNRGKKVFDRVYAWLNGDNLGAIVLDGKVFWIEKTCSLATLPDYIYNFIKAWCRNLGYNYLYDLPIRER